MLGGAGLKALLREFSPLVPTERLAALFERLDPGDRPLHDDMTILLVQRTVFSAQLDDDVADSRQATEATDARLMNDVVSIRIPAQAGWLKLARELLGFVTAKQGCSARCSHDVILAVDEACQNVIRHAYGGDASGDILIDARCDGVVLKLDIIDFAPHIDPSTIGPRDLDDLRPGGLGTHFINECVDRTEFRPTTSGLGNRLWLSNTIS
jgi:sigma-B regulation protein RsbU (phosphoserine phosphatase)